MDFWMTAVVVFLLCAAINLPYFVMELRKDQRKKQAEAKKPVQPLEPPKQSKQEEMKPQTVKTEQQEKKIPVQETPVEKKEEPVTRKETSIRANAELIQYSEECLQKTTTKKYENMEEALRAVTLDGIEEPEYDVIFDIHCDTCGHDGKIYNCGGRYHYDKNGILRKLHRGRIGFMMGNLGQPGVNTDCYVYDERGRLVRAVECGRPSGHGSTFFYFSAFCYKLDDPSGEPFWGIKEMPEFMRDEEGRIIIRESCRSHETEVSPFFPKTPSLSWWCNSEERAQTARSIYYDCDEPSDKEINGYRILKASPEQAEKLIRYFEERKSEYFEEPDVFTGECGDGMT